jgi:hypothetical protein
MYYCRQLSDTSSLTLAASLLSPSLAGEAHLSTLTLSTWSPLPELGWLALCLAWPGSTASPTWGCPGMNCWDPGFDWVPANNSCPCSWIGICVTGKRKKAGNQLGWRLEIHSGRLWAKASMRGQNTDQHSLSDFWTLYCTLAPDIHTGVTLNVALRLQTLYNAWYTLLALNLKEAACSNANSAWKFKRSKNT